jgi:gliding motility-associated protein GldM
MMATKADGWKEGSNKTGVENDQDLEIAEHYFVTDDKGKNGKALRDRLVKFQEDMKKLLIDEDGKPTPEAVKFEIDTRPEFVAHDGTKKEWHEYYFGGVPVIAAITEITKFQNDVRNAQSEVTNHLYKQIGAADVKFDNIIPIVSSSTPAVYQGGKYKAEIYLGAYSSTQQFQAIVNGQNLKVENGKALYEATANGTGSQKVDVKIIYKDAKGNPVTLPISSEYQVFTGQATISADQMNVLYRGLDNPMSVSVPGFSDAQTMVNFGGLPNSKKGPGKFSVKPTASTSPKVTVSVSVKMPDGGTKSMGSREYRVRNIPRAEVLFGGKPGGPISKGEIMTVRQISAGLGPEFAFEGLKYAVLGYTIVISPRAGGQAPYIENITGNQISGNAKNRLQSVRTGDIIVIANVQVNGPAGKQTLVGTSLTVK